MKSVEIKGNIREKLGKKESVKLRKKGMVPCVLYGGSENVHFYSHENNFKSIVYTPNKYHVHLDLDGKKYRALLKDIQFHPVTDSINHIDFLQTFDDKEANVDIPIHIVGESIGVKNGGKLRQRRRHLHVSGLPGVLPEYLEVDITDLDIGKNIRIGDLHYDNLKLLDTPRAMVIQVISSRLAAKGMTLPVEEEAAEGAEVKEEAEEETGKKEE